MERQCEPLRKAYSLKLSDKSQLGSLANHIGDIPDSHLRIDTLAMGIDSMV